MNPDPLTDNFTLLFVDDEGKSRKYFSRIFRGKGQVLLAEDGAAGQEILRSEAGLNIGVVITDQIMPRMTGLDLLKDVSEYNPQIVRVLSTAYTDSTLVEEAVQSGLIDYFVSKPWDIPKLEEILGRAIEHYRHNLRQNILA